jgi:hypothetical protein
MAEEKVAVSPKITGKSKAFYRTHLKQASLNQSVTWVLDGFPVFYQKTLQELRGVFTLGELKLILDVLNGHGKLLMSFITAPSLIGEHIALAIEDAIRIDPSILEKWDIDSNAICDKTKLLTFFQKLAMELWASGFWNSEPTMPVEEWCAPLLA